MRHESKQIWEGRQLADAAYTSTNTARLATPFNSLDAVSPNSVLEASHQCFNGRITT